MAMVQSGFPEDWWDCSMECKKSLAERARQKTADDKTAYEKRCDATCDGPFDPSRSKKSATNPSPQTPNLGCHRFGKKMLRGSFMGSVCLRREDLSAFDMLIAGKQTW